MLAINKCGNCRACCRALGVSELEKPPWQMCRHVCNNGCGIYATRPESCVKYSCLWLLSQTDGSPLPPQLRPDRCGVIFDNLDGLPKHVYIARVAPGNKQALQNKHVARLIEAMIANGIEVRVALGDHLSAPARVTETDVKPHKPTIIRGM